MKITASVDFIEFAVAGTRYVNGRVKADNKRLGGTGFYSVHVKDSNGNTPKLREKIRVTLPNDLVSREVALQYQPWDPFEGTDSSDLAPFSTAVDKRISRALNHPLQPKPKTAKNAKPQN